MNKLAAYLFLALSLVSFQSSAAQTINAKLKHIGINPQSGAVVATPDIASIPGTACSQGNRFAWSAEHKTTSGILSVLLSAYYAEKPVTIEYEPTAGCLGNSQKAGSVHLGG